ncbi:MAG: ABC transporter permease [Chloroflexi bacterium]|nr:ABC transporter permease [Chloroflexota bacterium]
MTTHSAKVLDAVAAPRETVLRKLARLPLLSMVILGAVLFSTVFAPLLTPHDPNEINLQLRFLPPSWSEGGRAEYLLGTDTLGRDLLTRIFYGARVSLFVAIIVLAISGTIGLFAGVVAGYLKGTIGMLIMRLVDSLLAIPNILIALVFAITLGPSAKTVIIALSVVLWARIARVMRGEVLTVATQLYISQAKVIGASSARIMGLHTIPNVFNTFIVLVSLEIGWVILAEATLSFLGAGIPPPTASWGQMVAEGRGYIESAWWISFFPGLSLALTVLSLSMFGDWLRDRLDPKLKQL